MTSIKSQRLSRTLLLGGIALLFLFSFPTDAFAQSCPTGTSQAQGTCQCEIVRAGGIDGAQRTVCRATSSTGGSTGQGTSTVISNLGAGGATPEVRETERADGSVMRETIPPEPGGCSLIRMDLCIQKALTWGMSAILGGVAWVVLSIAAFMLWIIGGMFNWVVIKTVFEFGSYFGASEGMLIAWGIMRDLGNIILLFGFIFMGLATILNTHALDEYSARKALPRLIIFAVLLNFSLFASQIVIDVSNSFASVFTAQAGLTGCTANNDTIDAATGLPSQAACANNGIAGQVLQMAGISGAFSIVDIGKFMSAPEKHAPVYIGLAIFITITAVVLLAAAIMLVMRAVMLCLLMVLSPIGFAGMAIPPLNEFAKKWWKQLLSNAFFAPIYLLLVLISLKIMEGLVGQNENQNFTEALINGGTNAPQIFVIFAVVIGFMVGALVVAKSMGAAGADFATKSAGGFVLGMPGFVGRRTVGAGFNAGAKAVASSNWAKNNKYAARLVYNTLSKGATASYSTRGLATTLGKGAHIDFGKPNKDAAHGFHGIEEKAIKEREAFEKKLVTTEDDGQGVWKEKEEELKEKKEERKEYIQEALNAVGEQRIAVEKARLSNDKEALRLAREELDRRIRAFSAANGDATTTDTNGNKVPVDPRGYNLKKEQERLEKEFKAWKGRADSDKREKYVEGMEHAFELMGPFSPEAHANHEAAANIRKNAGKGKMDKALEDFKKAAKEEGGEGDGDAGGDHGGGDAGGGHGGGAPAAAAH
ncbi:MAG: hypothetical protein AAB582_00035 [Patescibacteria group bacterium]